MMPVSVDYTGQPNWLPRRITGVVETTTRVPTLFLSPSAAVRFERQVAGFVTGFPRPAPLYAAVLWPQWATERGFYRPPWDPDQGSRSGVHVSWRRKAAHAVLKKAAINAETRVGSRTNSIPTDRTARLWTDGLPDG
jgi:hypothetical protein